ncbi:carboxypeptidase-like regulatory domain-containing protein [Longimicrobium sp.]|uniref:carboxypeptidase-like regulatory domain-containing protein n=1 Tax=Longimicrobium sp. TaxID=2029185 RepID=UPI003B3A9F6D
MGIVAHCLAGSWLRAAAAALVILFVPLSTPAAAQIVRGRVVDAESGAAVALARVAVIGSGQRALRTTTAADGRFSVRLSRGGPFRVQVVRAGYAEAGRSSTVGPNDTVDVDVRVAAVAHRLEPVTVTARPRRLRVVGVFDQISEFPYARVNAVAQRRGVGVRGWFPTPSFCYHLSGNAERTGSVITLTVQARATGEACDAGSGSLFYNVVVRSLPPGDYIFRVLHTFQDDAAQPALVLDTTLAVR